MSNWPNHTFKRLSFIGKSQVSSNNNLHYIEHYMCIKHLTVDINPLHMYRDNFKITKILLARYDQARFSYSTSNFRITTHTLQV